LRRGGRLARPGIIGGELSAFRTSEPPVSPASLTARASRASAAPLPPLAEMPPVPEDPLWPSCRLTPMFHLMPRFHRRHVATYRRTATRGRCSPMAELRRCRRSTRASRAAMTGIPAHARSPTACGCATGSAGAAAAASTTGPGRALRRRFRTPLRAPKKNDRANGRIRYSVFFMRGSFEAHRLSESPARAQPAPGANQPSHAGVDARARSPNDCGRRPSPHTSSDRHGRASFSRHRWLRFRPRRWRP